MNHILAASPTSPILRFSGVGCGLIAATGLMSLVPSTSRAGVNFSFNFTDAPGIGFNADGQVGADRRAGLQRAGDYVASFLAAYNADIVVDVDGAQSGGFLAYANSNYNAWPSGPGFGDQGDVMRKILGGNAADPEPGVADGTMNWNFYDFQWAPGDSFQPGEFDLISTGIHELTHMLGFGSGILENGEDTYYTVLGDPSIWAPFDQFIGNANGLLINPGFELNVAGWNASSVGGMGEAGLYFLGPNAMAANAGNPVYLYSPTTWEAGSSGSHLDTDFYNGQNGTIENMMNHSSTIGLGADIRHYSAIELGILKDIGYTMIVPEPSACLLGAFGFVMLLGRRRP